MELPFIYDRSNLPSFIKRNRVQSYGSRPMKNQSLEDKRHRRGTNCFSRRNFTAILFLPPLSLPYYPWGWASLPRKCRKFSLETVRRSKQMENEVERGRWPKTRGRKSF